MLNWCTSYWTLLHTVWHKREQIENCTLQQPNILNWCNFYRTHPGCDTKDYLLDPAHCHIHSNNIDPSYILNCSTYYCAAEPVCNNSNQYPKRSSPLLCTQMMLHTTVQVTHVGNCSQRYCRRTGNDTAGSLSSRSISHILRHCIS